MKDEKEVGFKFISSSIHDPYFNLASEEFLLRQTDGYYFYLWINAPAVIVGINQNAIEEVNLAYTEENGIKVVRRQTGGGAVYHDLNNVCYTVIAPLKAEEDHYRKFTSPVIEYLNSIGVKAEFSGRNDITVDGLKISGNAQTVYKDRIMHHGTILFDTDMEPLSKALKPNKLKMESKGIKSVRARVTNVKEHLKKDMTAEEFYDGLCAFFAKGNERYSFTESDIAAINKLVAEKYSTFEWNVGRSPKGKNCFEGRFDFGTLKINFDTENGRLRGVDIFGDFFSRKDIKELAEKLEGVKFEKSSVKAALSCVDEYIVGAKAADITDKMFS